MVKMIKPKPMVLGDITKAIDLGLLAADAEVKANYDLATWNWDNRPEWKVTGPNTVRGDRILTRKTTSVPFVYVDLGTPPHDIVARNAPTLKFQSGFIPATKPGRLTSSVGASFGEWKSPVAVKHPGTKPRYISKQVTDLARGVLPNHIQKFLAAIR